MLHKSQRLIIFVMVVVVEVEEVVQIQLEAVEDPIMEDLIQPTLQEALHIGVITVR